MTMRVGLLAPEASGKSSYLAALCGYLTQYKNNLPDDRYAVRLSVEDELQRGLKKLTLRAPY